jgi:hypothetical protein
MGAELPVQNCYSVVALQEIVEEVQRVRDVQKEALEAKTGAAKSEPSKEPVTAAARKQ